MTDTPAKVLAARALIEAYDALNSDEHRADVDKRRELDLQREEIAERIAAREDAYEAAMSDKHAADEAACDTGEAEPAPNEDAARTIIGKPWVDKYTNGNHRTLSADEGDENDDALLEDPGGNGMFWHPQLGWTIVQSSVNGIDPHESETCRAAGAHSED